MTQTQTPQYIKDRLHEANVPSTATVYWRDRHDDNWHDTPFPDGADFWDVSDYEYIAYTDTDVYVYCIYDCCTSDFYRVPLSPTNLTQDVHCIEAG